MGIRVGVVTMSGMPMLFWEGKFLTPPPSASGPRLPPTVPANPRQTTGPVTCHVSGFLPSAQFLCGPVAPHLILTVSLIHTLANGPSWTTKRTFGVVNGSVWPSGH